MKLKSSTFGILGIPVDEFALDQVVSEIDRAVVDHRKFLISTVNTNFLVNSRLSERFRQSLMRSDLCTVDGIGMLLMCRLAFVGKITRVSGADLMEKLLGRKHSQIGRPLRIFFFGGNQAVADKARHVTNKMRSSSICCVGSLNPGFGSMEELSRPELIKIINDAHPDFLVAALGAERGQEWLMRNRASLNVPVCAHLGAAVNFVAGSVQRAPGNWQKYGLEWLWRIRQEPALARRYSRDGLIFMRLLLADALPTTLAQLCDRLLLAIRPQPLQSKIDTHGQTTIVTLQGAAVASADVLSEIFDDALSSGKTVTLDCSALHSVDPASIGQIMRLERNLYARGHSLILRQVPRGLGHSLYPYKAVA